MFILTDYTTCPRRKYNLNDINTIGDIVLGISGSEEVARYAMKDAGDMHFGDMIIGNPYYILECVREGEVK